MLTLTKVVAGLGTAGGNTYKDIYKAAKGCMTDRSMTVRSAAAKVRLEIDLEIFVSLFSLCLTTDQYCMFLIIFFSACTSS